MQIDLVAFAFVRKPLELVRINVCLEIWLTVQIVLCRKTSNPVELSPGTRGLVSVQVQLSDLMSRL